VKLTVNSAVQSIDAIAVTAPFGTVATILDTSTTSNTVGTGTKTFTTTTGVGLHSEYVSTTGSVNAGSTSFTDASVTFNGSNVGDLLNITNCTGTGCLTGFYRVMSLTSAHVVVLDRTPTDGVHNATSLHYVSAVPVLIYDTANSANWMYGVVFSDNVNTLVLTISSVGGSGTFTTWSFGRPYWVNIAGVGGTTEANGNNQILTVADGTHLVLQNSTFSNAYTSGGYGGVQTLDADICLGGNSLSNVSNQLTLSNVSFDSSAALGQPVAPAYIIESSNGGGVNGDYVGIFGGSLIKVGTANVNVNYTSFSMAVENWIVAPPTHYFRQALGVPAIIMPEIAGGAKFTVSGCSNTNTLGGSSAGQFTSGVSSTCTATVTITDAVGFPAPNGWACYGSDITTGTAAAQTASTTTTATLSVATTSGDVVSFSCMGY